MIEGCVCLCSRGMTMSRTHPSIWDNLRGHRDKWEIVPSHDLPIPDAQNKVTEEALALDPAWLLYVEEDMVLPPGIVGDMLTRCARIVTADYPLASGGMATRRGKDGEIEFCGMGCLLVDARVFSLIPKPWFACNAYTGEYGKLGHDRRYGGQDVYFSRQCIERGIKISSVDKVCSHLRLEEPGALKTNQGVHRIKAL